MTEHDVEDQVAVLLRRAQQRFTASRRRLIHALQAGNRPLTISQIAEIDTSLPQSTIYRNLAVLEDADIVTRIVTSDDYARFELSEHLTTHHHHLICTTCGDVSDFMLDTRAENSLERALHRAAETSGFIAESHRLDLLGTCSTCA